MAHPISEIIFENKYEILSAFKAHVEDNRIRLPENSVQRRNVFMYWYLERFDKQDVQTNISDLSKYFVYLSEHRIYEILFTNESRS